MSYFDDVIEPRLLGIPRFYKSNRVRWMCKDGRLMYIDEMTDTHLDNAINACKRRIGTAQERNADSRTLNILTKERDKRK